MSSQSNSSICLDHDHDHQISTSSSEISLKRSFRQSSQTNNQSINSAYARAKHQKLIDNDVFPPLPNTEFSRIQPRSSNDSQTYATVVARSAGISDNDSKSSSGPITTIIPTYPSFTSLHSVTNNPAADLFYSTLLRNTSTTILYSSLSSSWHFNAEVTLQILAHTRDCREGKGEKQIVLQSLLWLRQFKQLTYLKNLLLFLQLGYFKDLLQLSVLIEKEKLNKLGEADLIELEILADFLRNDDQILKDWAIKYNKTNVYAPGPRRVEKSSFSSRTKEKGNRNRSRNNSISSGELALETLSVSAPVSDSRGPFVDVCFVVDCTGSMEPWIAAVKMNIFEIVSRVDKECKEVFGEGGARLRFAFLGYRDYVDHVDQRFEKLDFTENATEFHQFVQKVNACGGDDEPEDLIGGLNNSLSLSWSEKAHSKLLLLIADAPCHGKDFQKLPIDSATSLQFMQTDPLIGNEKKIIEQIKSSNIHLSFTRISTSTDIMLEKFQFWFDDRKHHRMLRVMQLGTSSKDFLPQVVRTITSLVIGKSVDASKKIVETKTADDGIALPSLSLAAKWAPTENSHFDKQENKFAHRVAALLYPQSKIGLKLYRKSISALRKQLKIVERDLCLNRWEEIEFSSVPARAHARLKNSFQRHQQERYQSYLTDLQTQKEIIHTTGIEPHDLIKHYRETDVPDVVIEAQWKDMVKKLKEEGELSHALAVVDVSGSMTYNHESGAMNGLIPIDIALSLALLISELTLPPFSHRLLTFSSNSTWHIVDQPTLCERVNKVHNAVWGGTTNLSTIFEQILQVALSNSISAEYMPQLLFIFSDMDWNGDLNEKSQLGEKRNKFKIAGYEPPQVIFWNLSAQLKGTTGKRDFKRLEKIDVNDVDVMMLSGYSSNMLKMVLGKEKLQRGETSAWDLILKTVSNYDVFVEPSEIYLDSRVSQ